MLLTVLDGEDNAKTICAQAPAVPIDRSGVITSANVSQTAIPASNSRSGWLIQNTGINSILTVSDLGNDATAAGAILLQYGDVFPPPGYPVFQGAITIAGPVAGTSFSGREW